jgi:predicted esterase
VRLRRALLLLILFLSRAAFATEQEFRLEKPDAKSVELVGEFNHWKAQPMKRQSDGAWTLTLSAPPGTYGYKFLVNGTEWIFDPNNPNRKKVDGIENSSIEIVGGTPPPGGPSAIASSTPSTTATPSLTSSGSIGPSPAITSTAATLAPTPGEVLSLEVPLSAKQRAEAAKAGNPRLANARMAVAVPQGFDPQKSWPVIVINNTLDAPNIDAMNQFKQAAVDEGWVIMAADAPDSEKDDKGAWRWPTIAAAIDYVIAAWPTAKSWPIACGGMSGGAKNSTFIAADLARDHHRVIGMLMMGCNQDMATVAYRRSAPPGFLNVPVFLSSGKSDTIATPAQHEVVKNSLRATGFQKVRLESFDGAHDVYQPHVTEALKWFVAQSSASAPMTQRPSEFDKFFKKKP